MFGELLAFGGTVEEQARFTLHIHFLLWLKYFNSVRNNMFSEDPVVREKARSFMVEYVSKIMTASYPDLEVTHDKSRDVNEACPGKMIPVSDQEIRNIRQKTKCLEAKGVVAKCNVCKQSFTTVWMVNNSLNIWKSKIPSEHIYNFNHPMSEERSDVYSMLFLYRNTVLSKKEADSLKEKYYKVLNMIKFNEHDYYHRRSCFKKGNECRFKTPNQVNGHNPIRYEKEESVWTRFD